MIGERRQSVRNESAFILALVWTIGFLGLAFLVVLRGVPDDSKSEVQQLMSIMSMIMAAMAGYFYGASKTNTETAVALAAKTKAVEAEPATPTNGDKT